MELHLYDTEEKNPISGTIYNIDYDYQAEMWVQTTHNDPKACNLSKPEWWVIWWELVDGEGVRARWERPVLDRGLPKMVFRAGRYTGDWKEGT